MDLLQSGHAKQEDTRAQDSAIMLFGKHITNLSAKDDAENIKEELSPRGVDEKGLSFATSSDDDEDLYPACEDAMHVTQSMPTPMASVLATETSSKRSKKRKGIESECAAPDADAEKPKSVAAEPGTVRMGGGDNQAAKLKGGMWSRCPRCNSADTKFCYFNNYNVNQPRHFCKHCQRYWTAGGTLRNVPIGAGKRKNKHALHKNAFLANSTSSLTVSTSSLPVDVRDPGLCSIVKSDPLPTTESDPLSIVKPNSVNTNLELSVHQSLTNSPIPSLPPCNIIHPHSAHQLITLHQLQENLQSRLSQINHPHLANGCSKLGQVYPNLACGPSPLSPSHPELADGCSKFSQLYPNLASGPPGLSQISPFSPNGSHGLSQGCPHLHGALPGVSQIWADLQSGSSEMARLGPHMQSGSCRLCNTYPHVQSGSCKTSQECLDCIGKEHPGSAKSGRGFPEMDEVKGNLANELPMSDQKYASLDRGLPNLARSASETTNLENKASSFQIGHLGVDPHEVLRYMQRFNEMRGGSATDECKAHMRGACNGMIETKAPPLCIQGDRTQVASTTGLRIKPEEAFNMESVMKRGGEGHNSLSIWGGLWPCFYNMLWLDPLALSHFRPILTPQGWALPFMPPSASKVEPTFDSPHRISTPTTFVSENFDCSSTLTPTTALLAPNKDVFNGACSAGNTSPGKHHIETPPTTS